MTFKPVPRGREGGKSQCKGPGVAAGQGGWGEWLGMRVEGWLALRELAEGLRRS